MAARAARKIERASDDLVQALDGRFLKALSEPVRVELIQLLLLHGEADIGSLAEQLMPDRSVVSRHLQVLADAGLLHARKEGRHRYYRLNAKAFVDNLEDILGQTKRLINLCCPEELAGSETG